MSGKFISLILIILSFSAAGQDNPWLFPIKPGEINSISGSVGELRTTHFHTGLDIKTEGVEGLKVYASGDGYISRISVSPGGYGHALYIKHPNGFTTVYAHLQKFADPIADYILKEQYRTETFALNRYPSSKDFPVKKGDIIGFSGNSGSSAGPHLHWDMRDPYERPVNSLKYKFNEIRDTRPPIIRNIAFRTMDINSTVNGEFGRFEFPVTKVGDAYRVSTSVSLEGSIGFEILAYDKLDDSYNNCGISEFYVYNDNNLKFTSEIEKLSFARQRSIYSFYNYETQMKDGNKFTKLYIDDGNDLSFYADSPERGILHFKKGEAKTVRIVLKDSYENESSLIFKNSANKNVKNRRSWEPGFSISENTMRFVTFTADNESSEEAELIFENGRTELINAKNTGFHKSLYLYDLRKDIPSYISVNNRKFEVPYKDHISPNIDYDYFGEKIDIEFRKNSLFDTLYISPEYSIDSLNREVFSIDNILDPLKRSIRITLKPNNSYDPSKYAVYSIDKYGNFYYQGGDWENGKISFRTDYFGTFTLGSDSIPPVIKPVRLTKSSLSFRIYDQLSGIKDYKASINGDWLLMHYDPKNSRIWSEKINSDSTFVGELLLEVTDNQGNNTTYKTTIE